MKNRLLFTREDVVEIIDQLLQRPDVLMDAIQNEHTDNDAETLLDMVEGALYDPKQKRTF